MTIAVTCYSQSSLESGSAVMQQQYSMLCKVCDHNHKHTKFVSATVKMQLYVDPSIYCLGWSLSQHQLGEGEYSRVTSFSLARY